jgi:hypothetical protein
VSYRQGILRTGWLDPRSNKLYVKLSVSSARPGQVWCAASHRLLRTGAGGTTCSATTAGGGDARDDGGDPPRVRRCGEGPVLGMSLCPAGRWRMREAP